VTIDVETRRDGAIWLVGFGVAGNLPTICLWTNKLRPWIGAHQAGWVAYSASADRGFLREAGLELSGRVNDPMLALVLADERSWDERAKWDITEDPARGLKDAAHYFLGIPNWETDRIRRAKTRSGLRPEWDEIPDEELAGYCAGDVSATLRLFGFAEAHFTRHPEHRRLYECLSRPLQAVLDRATEVGVPVDGEALRRRLADVPARQADLSETVSEIAGARINLNSTRQKATLLYTTLGLPCPRQTEKGNPSTGRRALTALRGQHPVTAPLEQFSALESDRSLYTTWLRHLHNGRLYPHWNAAGMVSGRVSSYRPTLQNVPRGADVRSLFMAPEGFRILAADYKAFEFGVAAWLYEEPTMFAAYTQGDPHIYTATGLLGRAPHPATGERNDYGKTPNFSLLYGQSPKGFYYYVREKLGLSWTEDHAAAVHAGWHRLYPGVQAAWARIVAHQRAQHFLVSLSGRRRRWTYVNRAAERAGTNFLVQATAAELCHCAAILAMAESAMPSLGAELILTLHDGLVFLVPDGSIAAAARLMQTIMTEAAPAAFAEQFQCEIPLQLKAEITGGRSWGEAAPIESSHLLGGMS
jgi:DNA polymerase-1